MERFSFGKNPYIDACLYVAKHKISVGDNFYIGKFSQIECDAEIGNDVMFANRVALIGRYDHHYQQVGVPTRLASRISDRDYNW
jgi:acetyltransferase-like isoleucine patch superfamily enzyme